MPPHEDSSMRVANELVGRIRGEAANIDLVLFRVTQRHDPRIDGVPQLRKKTFLHNGIFRDVVIPFQKERGLVGNPGNILLCPDLLAEKHPDRVRIVDVDNPNDPAFIAQHIDGNSDLKMAFSIRNLVLFGPEIIAAFAKKDGNNLINVHPARLPGIRGLEGPFWSRLYGEQHIVTTMHVIDRGIDTGPTLDYVSKAVNGGARHPVSAYPRRMAPEVAQMIFREIHMRHILGTRRHPMEQPEGQSIYHTLPTDEEITRAYQDHGIHFTDGSDQLDWILRHFSDSDENWHEHRISLLHRLNAAYNQKRPSFAPMAPAATALDLSNPQPVSAPSIPTSAPAPAPA